MSEKTKFVQKYKVEIAFVILFVITITSMGLNGGLQSDFGNVDVDRVEIRANNGEMLVGKLYRPKSATAATPAPAVLAIHGYNNDKDVQRPHSMELAKRGIVVLAIDSLFHGDSDVNFSSTSTSALYNVPLEAYDWLEAQTFVNASTTGVVGHSMGAYYAAYIALYRPQIDVVGYQAFAPSSFAPQLANAYMKTNWIQIWSSAEEFGRAWNETVPAYEARGEAAIIKNTNTTGVGDGTGLNFHTYGDITAGTAQRYVYIKKTHPGQTHDLTATKEITSFFLQSLTGVSAAEADASLAHTTYILADFFGALSALTLMLSLIPLAMVLMKKKAFEGVEQPMPELTEDKKAKEWLWWSFATVNFILGAVLFAINTSSPTGWDWMFDGGMIREWTPSMRMAIANMWEAFYVVNAVINLLIMAVWFFAYGRKRGWTGHDLGISYKKEKFSLMSWSFVKTIVLAIVLFLFMYAITAFGQWAWVVEVRGPWSMFKVFTTSRAIQFWRYYWGVLFFWLFNAGMWLFGLMRQKEYGKEWLTILIWWLKACFAMLTGLILLNMICYLPLLFGWSGPFLGQYNFAPMNLLQTWAFIPTAAVMLFMAVFFYRKTGKVYLAAIILAALGTWLMVTGTIEN